MTSPDRRSRGQQAEMLAEEFLQRQGLILCCRNFYTRYGEIDRIFHDGATLVFVEVRYRRRRDYGSAAESVNLRKQQRLRLAAEAYLQSLGTSSLPDCRFDVVAIEGEPMVPDWCQNAF
ncbi:YraN family protein [Parathalassolituus penaei]|uniref:UPF0102 protein OUO13_12345 n=1 Tax=Parathalassolituus penaei TaxID=2997323 RepID=A0A9X3EFW3_9GAMM|nr:YraN family protein [Parathalassolituus penaei]MCY0965980.1 YraN family protein [Parathalassolituus penaei]